MRPLNDHVRAIGIAESLFPLSSLRTFVLLGNPASKARPTKLPELVRRAFPAPMNGNVFVVCIFFRSNRQRIDSDNMMKNLLDSATGVLWVDDCQVTAQLGIIELDPARPRTVLAVGEHQSSMGRIGRRVLTCVGCGERFESVQHKPKFCSRQCALRSADTQLTEPVPCAGCGALFKRSNHTQKFCRRECGLAVWSQAKRDACTTH